MRWSKHWASDEISIMILVGNQRGGAKDLAQHLLKDENDHIEVYELRGFAAPDLRGAFNEAYALSRGTRCKQYLFSLSLNPPSAENVKTEDFEAAIVRIEADLGLTSQPRAIVFHEKRDGRRHAHCVWSRIRADDMKAVQLSFSHKKLMKIARELYIEHGWKMPRGLTMSRATDPRNFTLAEWQQAKRNSQDPRAIKTALQDAWAISDTKAALVAALEERGYRLAQGDSRAFVVLGMHGEVYALPRWIGVRTKEVRARLGDGDELPDVATAKARIAADMKPVIQRLASDMLAELSGRNRDLREEQRGILVRHREARQSLTENLENRRWEEARERQARFRTGLKGVWDWARGESRRIRERNEEEARAAAQRDRAEIDTLIFRQQDERRRMLDLRQEVAREYAVRSRDIRGDLNAYNQMAIRIREQGTISKKRKRERMPE
jgi:hypothetical protein